MKVIVGLASSTTHGGNHTDITLKLDASKDEASLLTANNVPAPGITTTDSQSLMRKCFATHGDFFREVGISNFRTFQPDWSYFKAAQSSGWQKFVARLIADENREEILRRIGNIVLVKLSLLTNQVKSVTTSGKLSKAVREPVTVKLVDMAGKQVEIKIGNQIFKAYELEEDAKKTALLDQAKTDLQDKATAQVVGFQSEFSNNLGIVSKQYEKEIADMKAKMASQVPALNISEDLRRQGVVVTSPGNEYQIFIPIKLHYKQIVTNYNIWDLKPSFQLKQDGYLMVAADTKFNYRWTNIYDKKFNDRLVLWHVAGSHLCLGSYTVKMKQLSDIVRVRDEVAEMLTKINTASLGERNLPTSSANKQRQIRNTMRGENYRTFKVGGREISDYDFNEVANYAGPKTGGKTWST